MIHEDCNQRFKETGLEFVCQCSCVSEILPIQYECIRASDGGIGFVKALASWTGSFVSLSRAKDALSTSRTIGRAKHVWADGTQSWTRNGGTKGSRERRDGNLLKVFFASVPLSIYLELQVEVLVDTTCVVATSFAGGCFKAHGVVSVLLTVDDINGIIVGRNTTIQLFSLESRVHRTVDGTIVSLSRTTHASISKVLKLSSRHILASQTVVNHSTRHLVSVSRTAPSAGGLVAEESLAVTWHCSITSIPTSNETR
mmetsp:Transcript_99/g.240  ORF Transcript_99/g.240 Transcript_99/m.240 type:complete len:256 (-) Transcript_99:717-1484(-)